LFTIPKAQAPSPHGTSSLGSCCEFFLHQSVKISLLQSVGKVWIFILPSFVMIKFCSMV
jgi:hypothetical protein